MCAEARAQRPEPSGPALSGIVIDTAGMPVAGATVSLLGTNIKTLSDQDGGFSINRIEPHNTLEVSCVGFATQQVGFSEAGGIKVVLLPVRGQLDEVVTIGYGKTTKRFNTGSVGKVGEAAIQRQPVTNVLEAMAGRIPGVFVKTENGLPGGEISIQVRGRGSIEAGTQPLYIIDGVPVDATPLNGANADFQNLNGRISPLNSLSPSEIESIEVLKDADATAIYGSRGANGVVLITTKTGRVAKGQVDLAFRSAISTPSLMPDVVSFDDYIMLREEGFSNDGVDPTTSNAPDLTLWSRHDLTDWSDWVMGYNAPSTQYNVAVTNTGQRSGFKLGFHHLNEATVLSKSHRYRRTGGVLNYRLQSENGKVSLLFNAQYTRDNSNTVRLSSFANVYVYPHNYPLYADDGQLNWIVNNPLAWKNQPANTQNEFFSTNATVAYRIVPDLELKVTTGFNSMRLDMYSAQPASTANPQSNPESQSSFGENAGGNYLVEPNLNYSKKMGEAVFTALIGGTWQYSKTEGYSIRGVGYSSETMLRSLSAAQQIGYKMDNFAAYKYLSGYARLSLNSRRKYLLNLSFRRDGSSKFGIDSRYGNFGAVGAAWIFSEEPLIRKHLPWLTFGKLRTSYGIAGNDQIGDYRYMTTYAPNQLYMDRLALQPRNVSNERFGWETTRKFEAALEAGLFGQRLNIEVGYFRHISGDQLISYPLPAISGPFNNYQSNFPGKVLNAGWEFSADATVAERGPLTWRTAFNLTVPRNELLRFPDLDKTSYANQYEVGRDLSIVRGYDFIGIDPQTGIPLYTDVNGDGAITAAADRVVMGKLSPDWYGGWDNTFMLKRFSLHVFLQFVGQRSLISAFDYIPGRMNVPNEYALRRWQKPGDITDVPIATAQSGTAAYRAVNNLNNSSAALINGSFIRGKNISLSYALPDAALRPVRIQRADISVRLQNAFTIFDRSKSNRDPETTSGSSATMPLMRTYSLGVNLTF
jgi:TonB-linked outer membrane protein, SusC/RagA family